jgi:sterol desaturase/sphingolipid hydroxylase (fatty acid hydroxylase superfamily)
METSSWGTRDKHGEWQPGKLPDAPALFRLPWNAKAAWLHLFGKDGYLSGWNLLFALSASVSWMYLTPAAVKTAIASDTIALTFQPGWIALIYLRNALLLLALAGGAHLHLYIRKAQGTTYKYTDKWLATDDKKFLFHNQTYDNVFWNFASGVVIWTAFEAVTLWMYGNGKLPFVSFATHPLYGVLMMVGVVYLRAIHFYWVHRFSHWRPLYDRSHYLHHKNVNIGPWSGLSMHPIEHLLYFSGILLHWVIPSHPLHAMFHAMHAGLAPAPGHTGFHTLQSNADEAVPAIGTDHYFHYLHHRYFTVNFGDIAFPLDKWFGSLLDGSPASIRTLMEKRRAGARQKKTQDTSA